MIYSIKIALPPTWILHADTTNHLPSSHHRSIIEKKQSKFQIYMQSISYFEVIHILVHYTGEISFLERALDLWQKAGVSLILVVGSSGAYFHIANCVVQMDAYHAKDITAQVKAALEGRPAPMLSAPGFHLPAGGRVVDLSGDRQTRKNYRGNGYCQERLNVKRFGKTAFSVGDRELDLRYVEQLVDAGQTQALAYMVRYAREHLAGQSVEEISAALLRLMESAGLGAVCGNAVVPAGLTLPRLQEIFACFNRY